MSYTYDDFLKAANEAGLMDKFSQADLDTAMKYPEFGLSILSLKQDFMGAKTAEQKALINEAANELRKSYGNYTGGADGSKYYAAGLQEGGTGSFAYPSAPTYENQYAQKQQELLDSLLNRGEFSWSKETDPQWGSYKKSYLREGERATADALAKASAATGGRPSSYAVNAAGQAGDYYAAQLNDVIPTLYQQAYDRYLDEYNMKMQDLETVNGQEQLDYAKYLNQLGQYNTDREFQYGMHRDTVEDQQQAEATEYSRSLYEQELAREQEEQQRSSAQAQVDAILAAGGTPSAELAAASGYSNEYIQALAAAYRQKAAEAAAQGAASGTETESGSDWDGLFAAAKESGHPQSFIANNYKAYGFSSSSGLWAEYQEWAETDWGTGYATDRNTNGMKASEWDMVLNNLKANLRAGNYEAAERYLDQVAGGMSEEQWNQVAEILQQYGYKGA